jgi:recombinational DNA repair protein RecR
MTLEEIETLIEDTKKLPRAGDKVALASALGVLEVARQLSILNARLGGEKVDAVKAGK